MKTVSRVLICMSCIALAVGVWAQGAVHRRAVAKKLVAAEASYKPDDVTHRTGVSGTPQGRSSKPQLADLDNIDRLRRSFQSNRGKVRLMALLSPT